MYTGPRLASTLATPSSWRLALSLTLLLLVDVPLAFGQYDAPKAAPPDHSFPWPSGKRAALSLTFDDARPSQVDVGLPLFARHDAHVTFYVSPHRVLERLEGWQRALLAGHEIGNHSLSHPCTGNFGFSHTNALEEYTLSRLKQDLDEATRFIETRLGVTPVSFAYPCGQTFVGRGRRVRSYVPVVAQRFHTGRLWLSEDANDPFRCDPAQLLAIELDGRSFAELRPRLADAVRQGKWLVLAGHEIGGGGPQTSLTDTLEAVCAFAADPANGLWLDTVDHVATHVLKHRPKL